MPAINKPTYIPYKWFYTCMFRITKINGVDHGEPITTAVNPLNNPQKLTHLYTFLEDKPVEMLNAAKRDIVNYEGYEELFYTFPASQQTDMSFPAQSLPNWRGFLIPTDFSISQAEFYVWDNQQGKWINITSINSLPLSSVPTNLSEYTAWCPTLEASQQGYFAIKIIPNRN